MNEIGLMRETIMNELQKSGKLDTAIFKQVVEKIPIICDSISVSCSDIAAYKTSNMIKLRPLTIIPNLKPIIFLGTRDRSIDIITYTDVDEVINHKFRAYTSNMPFAYSNLQEQPDGYINVYLFNFSGLSTITHLSAEVLFKSVLSLYDTDPEVINKEFPAPGMVQDLIIERLTNRYINNYRRLNIMPTPNTQSDPNS